MLNCGVLEKVTDSGVAVPEMYLSQKILKMQFLAIWAATEEAVAIYPDCSFNHRHCLKTMTALNKASRPISVSKSLSMRHKDLVDVQPTFTLQ